MTKRTDWDIGDPELAYTLPSRFFYDDAIFAEEKTRIFYKAWHAVAHESEFDEPGAYVTFEIFDQSVIVIRGSDGDLHAFHNVCQHRGNRLIQDRRGKRRSVIRCGYHAWCYGLEGELRTAPRTDRLKGFDRKDFGLKRVRVETLGRFVFVNLDADAEPLASIAPGAEAEMRRYLPDLDRMKLVQETDVIVPANWKVIMDNSIEGYHFSLSGPVHKNLVGLIDFAHYQLTPYGKWWTYIGPPKAGANSAYGESLEDATYQTDHFFNIGIWPNTTFYSFPFSDIVATFLMIPLEPEKSLLRFGYYAPDNRELSPVTRACIRWMNEELGPEDIQLNVTQQKGLRSFGYDQGRYIIDPERPNESEHLVHHFHKLCYEAIRG